WGRMRPGGVHMRRLCRSLFSAAILACWGCGGGSTGTLFGFTVDGLTGARLDFFDAQTLPNTKDVPESPAQIYAVLNGQFIRAVPCDPHDATFANKIDTSGCYRILELAAESFPVFAQRAGYQPFESRVSLLGASGALQG